MTNEIKQGEDLMSRNEDFDVDFNTFKEIRNKSTDLFEALHNAFSLGVSKGYNLAKAGK